MAQSLSVERLLDDARDATGLKTFGDMWFVAPLTKLIDVIGAEADLKADAPPLQRISQALRERLQMQALIESDPAILDEEVDVAGAILGLPRSGSTMLQRLLGSSPQLTSGYWWEVTFPIPFADEKPGDPSPRQAAAKAMVDAFYEAWPAFRAIHPMDAMAHDEEILLLDKTFLSSTYDSIMAIPSYGFWMTAQDHAPAYRELKTWLQVLQRQSPWRRGRRWLLKTPHHLLGGLDALLEIFPSARPIMTHRRVEEVLPSYCSMCRSISLSSAHAFDAAKLGPYWTRRFSEALRHMMAVREGSLGARFIDVRYADTVRTPMDVGESVLAALGCEVREVDRSAMQAWLKANDRKDRAPHDYTLDEFGLSASAIAADFDAYHRRYGL